MKQSLLVEKRCCQLFILFCKEQTSMVKLGTFGKWRTRNGNNDVIKTSWVFYLGIQRRPHDDVIKWKHFPRYWPFVRVIHRSRWIPRTWSFDVFFDLSLNERLSKQSRGWWFETQSHPLWRHCNGLSGIDWLQDKYLCHCSNLPFMSMHLYMPV